MSTSLKLGSPPLLGDTVLRLVRLTIRPLGAQSSPQFTSGDSRLLDCGRTSLSLSAAELEREYS